MKALPCILVVSALGLAAYAVVGRFVGASTLGFGKILPTMRATGVLTAANTLLLLGIVLKLEKKK